MTLDEVLTLCVLLHAEQEARPTHEEPEDPEGSQVAQGERDAGTHNCATRFSAKEGVYPQSALLLVPSREYILNQPCYLCQNFCVIGKFSCCM